MIKRLLKISAPLLACALLVAMCQVTEANPSFGDTCQNCHTGTGPANLQSSPDPLQIEAGGNGLVTFSMDSFPNDDGTVKLTGLQALLDFTLSPGWSQKAGTDIYYADYQAGGPFSLTLGVGASVALGEYPITVQVVGGKPFGSGWNTIGQDLVVAVTQIPEPTTLALLGLAGMGVCLLRRRR